MPENNELNRPIRNIDDLNREIGSVLLLEDKYIVRLLMYTIIANILRLGPIWIVVVAPPSGGKSELLQALYELKCVFPLSSLTAQTFISGMKGPGGTSTSLLDNLDGMILVMKDLTTMVDMHKDERRAIMSQFREIYDQRFDKSFGTGEKKIWEGHVGVIGAITPAGAEQFSAHGNMGERFIYYRFKQPDRSGVLDRAFDNQGKGMTELHVKMKHWVNEYMDSRIEFARGISKAELNNEVLKNQTLMNAIKEISNFVTMARSTVARHWKTGKVLHVHPHEMPTRFALQILGVAVGGLVCHMLDKTYAEGEKPELDELDARLLTELAWSSIPPERAKVIDVLGSYTDSTTKAIASHLGYETDVAREWLADLAALGLIIRDMNKSTQSSDVWAMSEKYRNLVCKYRGLKKLDYSLDSKVHVEEPEEEYVHSEDDEITKKLAAQSGKWREATLAEIEESRRIADMQFEGLGGEEKDPDDY